ncbi:Hypothetical predicted protein [Paramuricea clavata]|uniref:Uncharacterized protein n=1 Tax=Paramuricea clavata TaxID=317549 RepID=A0A7D9DT05_PARCT|nr:Hypothetical predicted protein [Paramuricea clavata]
MCMLLEVYVIFAILTEFTSVLASNSPGEGTGQKAHFSLEDTPGSFTVHANKILAKVSSKPDSIKVIVKPGMAEFPVPQLPTQKPLVHVVSPAIVRPVGGWNFMSFGRRKRSRIENGKESSLGESGEGDGKRKHFGKNLFKRSRIHSGYSTVRKYIINPEKLGNIRSKIEKETKGNSLKSFGEVDGNHKHFGRDPFKRLRRKNTVRKSLVKPRKGNKQTRFKNINIAKRFGQVNRLHRRLDIHWNSRKFKQVKLGNGHVRSGQKRESIERNMKVKGGAGKFNLHVDKKLTNVSSSTGGVEIFIKNPSPKQISQLPREMLQLPGAMLQLPNGMSQLYSGMPQSPVPVSQNPTRISQLPKEKPWVLVRLPYDWTGASNQDDDE